MPREEIIYKVKKDDYVRISKGSYKDDLAKVLEVGKNN